MFTDLLTDLHSATCPVPPRTTYPGMVLSTERWALPHRSLTEKMPCRLITSQYDGGVSSSEVLPVK